MFCLVKRPVRTGHEVIECIAVSYFRASYRDGYMQPGDQGAEVFRLDTKANLLGYHQCSLQTGGGQQHDEFLSPPSGHGITAAKAAAHDSSDTPEHLITNPMPMRVVDALEMVDIDKEQRQKTLGTAPLCDFPARMVDEPCTIQRPGKSVAPRPRLGASLQDVASALDVSEGKRQQGYNKPNGLTACNE